MPYGRGGWRLKAYLVSCEASASNQCLGPRAWQRVRKAGAGMGAASWQQDGLWRGQWGSGAGHTGWCRPHTTDDRQAQDGPAGSTHPRRARPPVGRAVLTTAAAHAAGGPPARLPRPQTGGVQLKVTCVYAGGARARKKTKSRAREKRKGGEARGGTLSSKRASAQCRPRQRDGEVYVSCLRTVSDTSGVRKYCAHEQGCSRGSCLGTRKYVWSRFV